MDTAYWTVAIYAWLFGTGLGLAMMTITTPIQNAVDFRDMGVATSAATFGRSLGGAIGAALFGAILTSRLAVYLSEELAGSAGAARAIGAGGGIDTNNVQALQALEEPVRSQVLGAYTHAITDIFLYSIPVIVAALVVVLFLKEIPLRTGQAPVAERAEGESTASGRERDRGTPAFSGH